MVEVVLDGLSKHVEEGTVHTWFVEEGHPVNEGDDLVEISNEEGTITIVSPKSGVLSEVYYDEGEIVARGEIICTIDDDESPADDDDDDEEEDEDEDEEDGDKDDDEEEDDDEDEEKDEE